MIEVIRSLIEEKFINRLNSFNTKAVYIKLINEPINGIVVLDDITLFLRFLDTVEVDKRTKKHEMLESINLDEYTNLDGYLEIYYSDKTLMLEDLEVVDYTHLVKYLLYIIRQIKKRSK